MIRGVCVLKFSWFVIVAISDNTIIGEAGEARRGEGVLGPRPTLNAQVENYRRC